MFGKIKTGVSAVGGLVGMALGLGVSSNAIAALDLTAVDTAITDAQTAVESTGPKIIAIVGIIAVVGYVIYLLRKSS